LVVTDENKLRQIFVNLLGNAVKFTDAGSIELRVDVRRGEDGKSRLVAEVEDTGRGIATEDTERMFSYFEQADGVEREESGAGLGLAICREFVRLLGGEISVESHVGRGSVFRFDVAITGANNDAVPNAAKRRHVMRLCPGEPRYRVLAADDAPDNRELLVQLLQSAGFEARSASNGQQVMECFQEWHPQLILLDMRMPVMDGYQATKLIRMAPEGSEVAIIGVTAGAFAEMRERVLASGVDEFVAKPFDEDELFEKMGDLLGARYVYDDESVTERPVVDALGPGALSALPAELASRIRAATLIADFDVLFALADETERTDERLAEGLRGLSRRFDAEGILAALG
jgi:CheY-like chemotaxis protein